MADQQSRSAATTNSALEIVINNFFKSNRSCPVLATFLDSCCDQVIPLLQPYKDWTGIAASLTQKYIQNAKKYYGAKEHIITDYPEISWQLLFNKVQARATHKAASLEVMTAAANDNVVDLVRMFDKQTTTMKRRLSLPDLTELKKRQKVDCTTPEETELPDPLLYSPHTSDCLYGPRYRDVEVVEESNTSTCIWDEWERFSLCAQDNQSVSSYCPERHGIFVIGEGIRPRLDIPQSAYDSLNDKLDKKASLDVKFKDAFAEELSYVNSILDQTSNEDKLFTARCVSQTTPKERRDHVGFLQDFFILLIRDIFIATPPLSHSESMFLDRIVWPCLKASMKVLNKDGRVLFFPGEERLNSMTKQTSSVSIYLADGVVRQSDDTELEVLILEAGRYGQVGETKVSFDFHKAVYGCAAMLKTLASTFNHAIFDIFSNVKIYFLHAYGSYSGTELRLWSLSNPSRSIFLMKREAKVSIPIHEHKEVEVLAFIEFFWNMQLRVKQTLETIRLLKQSSISQSAKYRYEQFPEHLDLAKIVEPSIYKLSEKTHGPTVKMDGPQSSPNMPPSLDDYN